MKVVDTNNKKIEFKNTYWPLAEDLFLRWGMKPTQDNVIKVTDVEVVAIELAAWGIPWERTC